MAVNRTALCIAVGALLVAVTGLFSTLNWQTLPLGTENLDRQPKLEIKAWHGVVGFPESIAQFETVFWEPRDTQSLRDMIFGGDLVTGKGILEIGTGTGLLAIAALLAGADRVVATDINPAAVANAMYNAELCGVRHKLDVRQVPIDQPGPFSVIDASEQFDLILSNPPWEDAPVERIDQFALYDPHMALCDGLLEEAAEHLSPSGKMLLAYGAKNAIQRILGRAPEYGWQVRILDDRSLDQLPEVFVPAMVIELKAVK